MVWIELTPTLTHCIETTAKQEFVRNTDEYLQKGKEDRELEEKIELLRMFLESMNFGKLRAESEKYLTEGKKVTFTLYMEGGEPKYEMEVE
ncbi:MAG: hypothetical protein SVO26_01340 [Chloroflexota bacterium]|nr:hypothetical protein [Chloroflexota bacterium]